MQATASQHLVPVEQPAFAKKSFSSAAFPGGRVIRLQERIRPAIGAGSSDFSLTFTRDSGAVVVGVVGELDCATASILEQRMEDLLTDQGNLTVVLDLAEMSFIDSSGLSVFVTAFRNLRDRGGNLTLRRPSPSARRVFEITGLHRVLNLEDL